MIPFTVVTTSTSVFFSSVYQLEDESRRSGVQLPSNVDIGSLGVGGQLNPRKHWLGAFKLVNGEKKISEICDSRPTTVLRITMIGC